MMEIRKIAQDKKKYIDLLLLADEQESMIDRYLDRGEMYAGFEGERAVAICVLTDEGNGVLEIKNLAVAPDRQGKGYGRGMIEYVAKMYRDRFSVLRAGTGESPLTMPFYKKCGFEIAGRIKDFFTDNYDHPIIEDGVLLSDMVILERSMEKGMNTEKLFCNIVDVIEEGQLKLGYRPETIRLYYPLHSLNLFLGTHLDAAGMMEALGVFAAQYADRLGRIAVSRKGKRFCLAVPPEGAAYVNARTDRDGFLARFIAMIAKHGTRMDDVVALFCEYSPCVRVDELHNGEFDVLIRFGDGKPDAFYYCITDEGCHLTYHRFTKEDYEAFGF